MARRITDDAGGILGLLDLVDEHGEALSYDLIGLGLRLEWLGSERLTWRDLLVIVRHLPQDSALSRSMNGSISSWTVTDYLLADIFDALNIANWQRANAGKKSPSPKPKPYPRPGAKDNTRRIGRDPLPIPELDAWIAAAEC
jgi:hypothetical protein